MIDLLRSASNLQFILAIVALIAFVMIVLQAFVRRAVWTGYLVLFFGSLIGLAVTLR